MPTIDIVIALLVAPALLVLGVAAVELATGERSRRKRIVAGRLRSEVEERLARGLAM